MFDLLLKPWMATCHETRDKLSDFIDDDLTSRDRMRIVRHLSGCKRCRALLESLTRAVDELRSLGDVQTLAPAPATVRSVLGRIELERR